MSAFSFYASLLPAIDGVMPLALCPQVVSQALVGLSPRTLQIQLSFLLKKNGGLIVILPCTRNETLKWLTSLLILIRIYTSGGDTSVASDTRSLSPPTSRHYRPRLHHETGLTDSTNVQFSVLKHRTSASLNLEISPQRPRS